MNLWRKYDNCTCILGRARAMAGRWAQPASVSSRATFRARSLIGRATTKLKVTRGRSLNNLEELGGPISARSCGIKRNNAAARVVT